MNSRRYDMNSAVSNRSTNCALALSTGQFRLAHQDNSATSERCRVGFIVSGWQQRAWVLELQKQLAARVEVVALVVLELIGNAAAMPERAWRPSAVDKAYLYLEHALFGRGTNPFATVPISPKNLGTPVVSAKATMLADGLSVSPTDELRNLDITVGVAVGPLHFSKDIERVMRFGTLVLQSGSSVASSTHPGFIETIRGDEAISFRIDLYNGSGNTTLFVATARKSRTAVRNAQALCRKAARSLADEIAHLRCEPDSGTKVCRPTQPSDNSAPHLSFRTISKVTGKAAQYIVDRRESGWMFAYSKTGVALGPRMAATMLANFKKVLPPADRFWADPFPVMHHGRAYVFVEEFLKGRDHAHISVIELDGERRQSVPVLLADYHLSYPFILRWQNEHFMVPESSRTGQVGLYRATRFPFAWTLERILLDGVYAADATMFEVEGTWWLFASEEPSPDTNLRGDTSERLLLFYAPTPLGPWQAHRHNPVKFDISSARPAGGLFQSEGRLFRPAQDCARRYGYAINVNEVLRLTRDEFQERPVSRIAPTWAPGLVATHTINADGPLVVVDGRLRARHWGG